MLANNKRNVEACHIFNGVNLSEEIKKIDSQLDFQVQKWDNPISGEDINYCNIEFLPFSKCRELEKFLYYCNHKIIGCGAWFNVGNKFNKCYMRSNKVPLVWSVVDERDTTRREHEKS